jgi:hypothetical protein
LKKGAAEGTTMKGAATGILMAATAAAAGLVLAGCGCDAGAVGAKTTAAPLVRDSASPSLVAAGHANVYWADEDGSIHGVSKSGGTAAVVDSGSGTAVALVADGDSIAWATADAIYASDAPGAAARVVASGRAQVLSLAIDADGIYWSESVSGSLYSAPRAGGALVTLASAQSPSGGMAVDQGTLYFATTDSILAVPTKGGAASKVATPGYPIGPGQLVAAGGSLAWVDAPDSALVTATSGSAPQPIASGPIDAIAADAQHVFYVSGGVLASAAWSGSAPVALDHGDGDVAGMAVGESTVYFAAPSRGEIFQVLEH